MVAALAQLHGDVHERGAVGGLGALEEEAGVALEHGLVELLLHRHQRHLDNGLLLGRDVLLHHLLGAPQQVPENKRKQNGKRETGKKEKGKNEKKQKTNEREKGKREIL